MQQVEELKGCIDCCDSVFLLFFYKLGLIITPAVCYLSDNDMAFYSPAKFLFVWGHLGLNESVTAAQTTSLKVSKMLSTLNGRNSSVIGLTKASNINSFRLYFGLNEYD